MNRLSLVAVFAPVALVVFAALPDPAAGCGIAPPPGEYVSTAEETALIVWDEKTKTEHFVRRASFHSTGYDFGFLVPTPTRPHLDLADDNVFQDLSALTAAKFEYREEVREVNREFAFGCLPTVSRLELVGAADKPASPGSGPPGGVDVLEQKKLDDYDVAVLRFRPGTGDAPGTGAAELTKWLTAHGFEASDAIRTWLERYVKDEWCITAFKIGAKKTDDPHGVKAAHNPTGRARDLRAKPVRMSFKAERPFYPYREPAPAPTKQPAQPGTAQRLLRVFVAAPARYAGTLGDGSKPWPGQTVWAGPVDAPRADGFFKLAKLTEPVNENEMSFAMPKPAAGWWLTEFEDRSSPRPGTDEVYFAPSSNPDGVARPPTVVTNTKTVVRTPWWHAAVYLGVPVLLVVSGLATWRLLRRT